MSIGEVVREEAALAGIEADVLPDGSTSLRVGRPRWPPSQPMAPLWTFRLDPAVAAAAQRTPDTVTSERGPDWVVFAPVVLDAPAVDRAIAWFGSAARRAGGG